MGQRAFTDDQVAEIKTRLINGETTKTLAQEFGVSTTTIKNVRRGLYAQNPKKTGPKPKPVHERLWARIQQGQPDECWLWTGACRKGAGPPTIGVGQDKSKVAYRALYEDVHNVTLDTSLSVLHSCRNALCMNPNHLYLGTKDDWAAQLQKAELSPDEAQREIARRRSQASSKSRDYYHNHKKQRKQYTLEYQLERKLAAVEYKGGKCQTIGCQETHPAALQFHHRDPTHKEFGVNAKTLSMPNKIPWQRMREELDKCDLLCGNCHAKHHTAWSDELVTRKRNTLENYGLAAIYEKKV